MKLFGAAVVLSIVFGLLMSNCLVADEIRSGLGEATCHRLQKDPDNKIVGGYEMKIVFLVKDGTKCEEDKGYEGEENNWKKDWAKVMILEGDYKGKTIWVLRKWLK